jgi:hypothetical protein
VFVAGEKSRNIVVISPDGNSAKEKGGISDFKSKRNVL